MGQVDEAARETPPAPEARPTWRELWPALVLPPLIVAAAVGWLWFGAEGGFVDAGRYTLS